MIVKVSSTWPDAKSRGDLTMAGKKKLTGPDFARGVSLAKILDGGMLQGHAGGEAVLVARRGSSCFAIGATCTHYGAPLVTGLIVGDTVRCPWHHACFSLRTGEALRAPALDPVECWKLKPAMARSSCGRRRPGRNCSRPGR